MKVLKIATLIFCQVDIQQNLPQVTDNSTISSTSFLQSESSQVSLADENNAASEDNNTRINTEQNLSQLLLKASQLEDKMDDAAIASHHLRLKMTFCTSGLGCILFVVAVFFTRALNTGLLDESRWGPAIFYSMARLPFAFLMILGIRPNDVTTIKAIIAFLTILSVFLTPLFILTFISMRFVQRHEVADDASEYENVCSVGQPLVGCVVSSLYFLASSIACGVFAISLAYKNFSFARNPRVTVSISDSGRFDAFRAHHSFSRFALPPRLGLDSVVWHMRCFTLFHSIAVFISTCVVLAFHNRYEDFEYWKVSLAYLQAFVEFSTFWAFTNDRRHRVLAYLNSLVAYDHSRSASVVIALLGGTNVKSALTEAKENFHSISAQDWASSDFRSCWEWHATTFGKTQLEVLGFCDAYVSHSWSDNGSKKWEALCGWVIEFRSNHNGKDPKMWLDKDCIKKKHLTNDFRMLPFYLAGCRRLICLVGPTYTQRLWCLIEVFVFVAMGGSVKHITVLPLEPTDEEKAAGNAQKLTEEKAKSLFQKIDVRECQSDFKRQDQKLLGIIELSFGNLHEFNKIIRQVFSNNKIEAKISIEQSIQKFSKFSTLRNAAVKKLKGKKKLKVTAKYK